MMWFALFALLEIVVFRFLLKLWVKRRNTIAAPAAFDPRTAQHPVLPIHALDARAVEPPIPQQPPLQEHATDAPASRGRAAPEVVAQALVTRARGRISMGRSPLYVGVELQYAAAQLDCEEDVKRLLAKEPQS